MSAPDVKNAPELLASNFTKTPNSLFALLPSMSHAELRVTLVLIRDTFGWHRQKTGRLTHQDIATRAGLSLSSTKTGIAEGEWRGTIRKHTVRDQRNRPTYRYSLAVTDTSTLVLERFERPRTTKTPTEHVQHERKDDPTSQTLTGSDSEWVKFQPGQKTAPSPVDPSSQNLTASDKEETNSQKRKEKRGDTALVLRRESFEEVRETACTSQTPPADAGAACAADAGPALSSSSQDQSAVSPDARATSSEEVPGGGAADPAGSEPRATEEYVRRKFGHTLITDLLEELPPRGVDRRDWFALPLVRVQELATEARRTHEEHRVRVTTRLKMLLDAECRRVDTPVRANPDDTAMECSPGADPDPLQALLAGTSLNGQRGRR